MEVADGISGGGNGGGGGDGGGGGGDGDGGGGDGGGDGGGRALTSSRRERARGAAADTGSAGTRCSDVVVELGRRVEGCAPTGDLERTSSEGFRKEDAEGGDAVTAYEEPTRACYGDTAGLMGHVKSRVGLLPSAQCLPTSLPHPSTSSISTGVPPGHDK